jgi:hypothetical protein
VTAPTDKTISFTIPATLVEVEPEFGGAGWTISMLIPPDGYQETIYELRIVREVIEHFRWCAERREVA